MIFLFISIILSCPDERFCRRCETVEKGQQCALCEYSYLFEGKCDQNLEFIKNCKIYDENKKCTECDFGFGLLDNKCVSCKINNCAKCNKDPKECTACANSIKGEKDDCEMFVFCDDPKCHLCSTTTKECFKCINNYALKEGKCLSSTRYCLQQDEKGCVECENGYYITSDNQCITNTVFIFNTLIKAIFFISVFLVFGYFLVRNVLKMKNQGIEQRDSYITIDSDELND